MPFDALPTRAEVLELRVGAFDPSMFIGDEAYTLVGDEVPNGVTVYKKNGMDDYTTETVFRIKDEFSSEYIYLKNIMSVVTACGSSFKFLSCASRLVLDNRSNLSCRCYHNK